MRTILLSNGQECIVDSDDYERLATHRWKCSKGYACRNTRVQGREVTVYMARFILNAPAGIEVDHIDGNPLNNTKANLRLATRAQNARNRKCYRKTQLPKGVYVSGCGYRAAITVNRKRVELGSYPTIEEAQKAYASASLIYHGEYGNTG